MQSSKPTYIRQKTFDPMQRILHWWLGTMVMALTGLGWIEKTIEVGPFKQALTQLHISFGVILSIGLLLRLTWGFFGPKQARFSALWLGMKPIISKHSHAKPPSFGYESTASMAYALFYLALNITVVTGFLLMAMRYDQGPFAAYFFDELTWHEEIFNLHQISLYATSIFFIMHIAGMIHHEKITQTPTAQAMISGYQYRNIQRKKGKIDAIIS